MNHRFMIDEDGYLTGKLLIAMPTMDDERFERSVILLCAHSEDHAMGIVINQVIEGITLTALLEKMDIPTHGATTDHPVMVGGPVGKDRGFVLHTPDFECEESTLEVTHDMCLTATKEVLHAIASAHPPKQSLLALGYSGWGPQQLESEIAENVWLIADADREIVFDTNPSEIWNRALAKIGITPAQLQSGSGTA